MSSRPFSGKSYIGDEQTPRKSEANFNFILVVLLVTEHGDQLLNDADAEESCRTVFTQAAVRAGHRVGHRRSIRLDERTRAGTRIRAGTRKRLRTRTRERFRARARK